jgi:hypothetical protein
MIDAIDELVARCKPHPELKAFHEFHRQNPEILHFLIGEIETRRNHGQKSFSFASLWHYCRWKVTIGKGPASTFKLNDHLTPYYARAIVILRPAFNGWAELRHRSVNEVFGLALEPTKRPEFYARRVMWADGTALENGWRPTRPHVVGVCEVAKRPDVHPRSA